MIFLTETQHQKGLEAKQKADFSPYSISIWSYCDKEHDLELQEVSIIYEGHR